MSSVLEIQYSGHQHPLKLKRPPAPYFCDGCKELGFGICYQCETCNRFSIHRECAIPTSPTYLHFFNDCRFEFYDKSQITPDEGRDCDVCGLDIKGYVYQCSCEKYDMHPHCAKLPETLDREGVKLQLKKKSSLKCRKCHFRINSRKGPKGLCYVFSCETETYCFHVACLKEMVYENWQNSYFNGDNKESDEVSKENDLALQSTVSSSSSTEIVEQKRKSSRNGWKMAILVMKLILSAIFGEPITGFTALVASLAHILFQI